MSINQALNISSPYIERLSLHLTKNLVGSHYLFLTKILILSKNNKLIAGSCRNKDNKECLYDIRLLDMNSGRQVLRFGRQDQILSTLSVSTNETLALTAGYSEGTLAEWPMYLWNLNDGSIIRDFEKVPYSSSSAFSACDRFLISGHCDGQVHLWDVLTGKILKTFKGHISDIIGVSFTSDGRYGISACYHEYVCIWDLSTGDLVARFGGSNSGAGGVSFSGNGKFVAFSGSVSFDDLDEVEEATYLHDDIVVLQPEVVRYRAAMRENSIRVWDIERRKEHVRLRTINKDGRTQGGCYIVLNYEGTLGISYSDRFTHLWDVTQGIEISRLEKYTSHAQFFSDSHKLLAGSSTSGISLYELKPANETPKDF